MTVCQTLPANVQHLWKHIFAPRDHTTLLLEVTRSKCSYYGVAMQLLEICLYQPACPRQLLLTSNDVLDVMAAVSIRLEQM